MTTLHTSGTLGNGTYQGIGPTITVAKNLTTTSLAAVSGAQVGKPSTLTANVSGGSQGDAVDFYDGAAKIGSGTLNGSGVATLAWTPTTAGARSVQAKYLGGAKSNGSDSSVQSVQVAAADVVTSMTVSAPSTVVTGTEVTLSAIVTPSNAAGTVQFREDGVNVGSPVSVAGGSASMQHTFSTPGNHDITGVFVPGAGFAESVSAPQPVVVTDPDVETAIALQVPPTAETGTPVTLTANLSPSNASGAVQFKDGTDNLGAPVQVSGGKAELGHIFTSPGNHSISAEFVGAPGFLGSTASAKSVIATDPQVPDVATTTTLVAPSTAQAGEQVTLTAELDPADAAGRVQFRDGATDIGGPVTVVNGQASLQTTFEAGSHSIIAVFTGNTGFESSTSSAQTVVVSDPVVQTSVNLSVPSDAQTGSAVSLGAMVMPANASGTVQFTDGGSNIGGPVTVSNGAASLSHTFTAGGTHTIGAVFTGAAGFTAATAATQTVQVSEPSPHDIVTTIEATVPATATVGQPVTLSATVDGGTNLPGTVRFYDGDTPIGGNVALVDGAATLQHTFTTVGAHAITARYSGGEGVKASESEERTVQVSPADSGGDDGGTGSAGSLGNLVGSLGGVGRAGFGS